jgi:NAD(P)-dependent dehydrogenase (short-subunit alcohol dehydrogenase family)
MGNKSGLVKGKVILVTGANSGIGRAAAILLAQHGAKLGLLDVSSPIKIADEIVSAGGEAIAIECDVRSPEQVEGAIAAACKRYGALDGRNTSCNTLTQPGCRQDSN